LANPELGAKQICPNCQTKFYDLNRRPAVCPKCGLDFDPEEAVRTRRVRTRAIGPGYEAEEEPAPKPREEDEAEELDEVEDTPEIDEAAEAEPLEPEEGEDAEVSPASPDPDLGVDFEEEGVLEEEGEDVPFLEEEDEDFPDGDIEGIPGAEDEH
jgi:uncharacterized protein (TIGR02300 family)